jgi:hypothetical protein
LTGLFRRSAPKPALPAPGLPARSAEVIASSKVLPRFLSALVQQPAPVLLDLGPVSGGNVSFFGERLACKIYVEDLLADIEGYARRGERDRLPQLLTTRPSVPDDSVDGILCWDLFDFLSRRAGQVLAARLVRLLRKGGALYGFFGTTAVDLCSYSRYAVDGDDRLRLRSLPATPVRREVLLTRDLIKMFDGLIVTESVLLKSSTRETLFRKP